MICMQPGFYKLAPAILEEESEPMPEAPEYEVDRHAMPESDDEHCAKLAKQNHCPGWEG